MDGRKEVREEGSEVGRKEGRKNQPKNSLVELGKNLDGQRRFWDVPFS